jgi:cytoplasmic iron level regulating protein YaaA (DUF328/UPF0246 family)
MIALRGPRFVKWIPPLYEYQNKEATKFAIRNLLILKGAFGLFAALAKKQNYRLKKEKREQAPAVQM